MERQAFARAWRFLNYDPLAKWLAQAAAVGMGILYVTLLGTFGLFADLLVNRGRIPSYASLTPADQAALARHWQALEQERRQAQLAAVGLTDHAAAHLAAKDFDQTTAAERAVLWRGRVHALLTERVGPAAAELVVLPPDSRTADAGLTDRGLLSLVVRRGDQPQGRLLGWLARALPWTWRPPASGGPNHFYYLTGLLVAALGLAAAWAGLAFLHIYLAARATLEATTRLRRAIYHHTFRLGNLAFRAMGPREAVSVFTRHLQAVQEALFTRLTVIFREPVKFVLVLVLALLIHFWLALAFLLFALVVWLVGGQVAAFFRREGRVALNRAAEQLALIQESLMMMRLVKTYLMELFNQSRVERQLARYARAQLRQHRGEAIYRPLLIFLGTAAGSLLLYVASFLVLDGNLNAATLLTLSATLISLYAPVVSWLEHRRFMRRGYESAVVLFKFLDRKGEVAQVVGAEFLPPLSKYLEFDNVTLKEPGTERLLLQNISLRIQAGQRVALVGPDETEKHALVYLLPRFLDPTAGEIRIDNRNLRWVTLDSLRAQIALVLQHNLTFNDTVANNIGCGDPSYTLPQIIEAAKIAHCHHFIQKLPQGYETPIGEMGQRLRIGEQYRIALARAILRDPALLLIEEPVEALDEDTKALVDDTFARVLPGRTTIFLPHRLATIRSCDRIFLLYKGKLEATGAHRELLSHNELYRHLHYLEFNEMAEQI